MWRNHPLSQRKKGRKKVADIEVCVGLCVCVVKRGVGIIWGLHKIGGLRTLYQLCYSSSPYHVTNLWLEIFEP